MYALIKIAWRNCWRSKGRTIVVVCSIIVGVWGSLILMGFMNGIMDSRKDNGINRYYSHLQIEKESFEYDQSIANGIEDYKKVDDVLGSEPHIVSFSDRFLLDVSLTTARNQQGAQVIGIDVSADANTVQVSEKLIEGAMFGDRYKMPIVIGIKMAEKLKVKMGSKINMQFMNIDTTQVGKNFRVVGIFKTGDAGFDEGTVFVPQKSLMRLTGQKIVHRILVKTDNLEDLLPIQKRLQAQMPEGVVVKTWKESAIVLAYSEDTYNTIMYWIMGIIIVALLFGIINTIVMSILERKREIGVLVAVGMNKNKVRFMIAFESMIYGLIGGPFGVFIGYLSIMYLGVNGLDLGVYGQGMEEFGLETVIYFSLPAKYYFIYGSLISFSSFVAGLYPAWLATKMNPIEAIRSI
jgi:putative ABC transport system permease protein